MLKKRKFDDENELLTLDIHSSYDYIVAEMSCQYPTRERLSDYTFMCFLLGNDFLPHFPALNIEHMESMYSWSSIIPCWEITLTAGSLKIKITMEVIQLFIQELAKCEYQYLKEEYDVRKRAAIVDGS